MDKETLRLTLAGYGDRPTPQELQKVLSGKEKSVPRLDKKRKGFN